MNSLSRRLVRVALRAWGATGVASGWHWQAFERLGPRLAERESLPRRLPNGCRIRCDLGDNLQRQIFFTGAYEPVECFLLTRLLRPGMTFIDVGANVGQYSLLASTAVGGTGCVHAFEPVPALFASLSENVSANRLGNVRLNRAALWHEPGELVLSLAASDRENVGAYSVGAGNEATAVRSPAMRLDDYAAENALERIDFIKMDVEGAELFALQGMREVLRRHTPMLLLELAEPTLERLRCSPRQVWDLLVTDLGYRAWAVRQQPERCLAATSLEELEWRGWENVLFHKGDLPAGVTSGWRLKQVLRWAQGWGAA